MHQHLHDDSSRRIGMVFFLNLGFTIIEFVGGWLTNSTAIMADAVHDLGDSLSIGSAWLLNQLGKRSANEEFTYGFRRFSLFGALINGLVLIAGSAWVLNESIPRLFDSVMPMTEGMLVLALLGVTVNGVAAYRLSKGKSLNEKVLNWHLLEDVLGWIAVLIVSIVLQFVEWPILDPLLSIVFTIFILINVLRNFWATVKLFFQAVPDKQLIDKIKMSLLDLDNVQDIHHLHLWSLDGEQHVLTAHVLLTVECSTTHLGIKREIELALAEYGLKHTTIEIEVNDEVCRDQ